MAFTLKIFFYFEAFVLRSFLPAVLYLYIWG